MISGFSEDLKKSDYRSPSEYVCKTCLIKPESIDQILSDLTNPIDMIISADTIVVHKNEILEKPASQNEAIAMLSKLSNSKHSVFTAITIVIKMDC